MNLLGAANYDPTGGAAVTKATTSLLAMTAFDTTNLRIAFTIPAHGMVHVRMTCVHHGSTTTAQVLLGCLEGSTLRGRAPTSPNLLGTAIATTRTKLEASFTITGLTPGAVNWDAAYGVEIVSSAGGAIKYGGPNNTTTDDGFGGFNFEIWDPRPLPTAAPGAINGLLTAPTTANVGTDDIVRILGTVISTPATAGILDVNVKNIDNDAASASGTVTFPNATLASTTNITAGTITTVTNLTNAPTAGDLTATMKTSVENAVLNADMTGHQTQGSLGQAIGDPAADTDTIWGLVNANLDATISSRTKPADTQAAVTTVNGLAANVITAAAINADAITAAKIAAGALNGKGDWNIGKTGYALSAAGIQAIWDALTTALTTVGSIGKLLVDNINATISSRATQASLDTLDDYVDTEVAAIKAKTDGLPADPADESNILAAIAAVQADTDNIQTRLPAALSGDGFMKSDLKSIEDELTSGYNATLRLKQIDIVNTNDVALNISAPGWNAVQITAGAGDGILISGTEFGMKIEGDIAATGNYSGIYATGAVGLEVYGNTGAGAQIWGTGTGAGVDVRTYGGGTGKSINAPQDIAVSDGNLTLANIASTVLASVIETGYTLKQSMRLMLSALAGKLSGAATTTVTIRDVNDAKNRIVATVDSDGNRTAVTKDVSD